jgi:hypothetical protein
MKNRCENGGFEEGLNPIRGAKIVKQNIQMNATLYDQRQKRLSPLTRKN